MYCESWHLGKVLFRLDCQRLVVNDVFDDGDDHVLWFYPKMPVAFT